MNLKRGYSQGYPCSKGVVHIEQKPELIFEVSTPCVCMMRSTKRWEFLGLSQQDPISFTIKACLPFNYAFGFSGFFPFSLCQIPSATNISFLNVGGNSSFPVFWTQIPLHLAMRRESISSELLDCIWSISHVLTP